MIMSQYINLTDANTYFEDLRFETDAWDSASDAEKNKALSIATADIDRLNFYGIKAVKTQELEFPRKGQTAVPKEIGYACCEQAYCYLDNMDQDFEFDQLRETGYGYASLRSNTDAHIESEHKQAGILSVKAWRYLKPFLASVRDIKFKRV